MPVWLTVGTEVVGWARLERGGDGALAVVAGRTGIARRLAQVALELPRRAGGGGR